MQKHDSLIISMLCGLACLFLSVFFNIYGTEPIKPEPPFPDSPGLTNSYLSTLEMANQHRIVKLALHEDPSGFLYRELMAFPKTSLPDKDLTNWYVFVLMFTIPISFLGVMGVAFCIFMNWITEPSPPKEPHKVQVRHTPSPPPQQVPIPYVHDPSRIGDGDKWVTGRSRMGSPYDHDTGRAYSEPQERLYGNAAFERDFDRDRMVSKAPLSPREVFERDFERSLAESHGYHFKDSDGNDTTSNEGKDHY